MQTHRFQWNYVVPTETCLLLNKNHWNNIEKKNKYWNCDWSFVICPFKEFSRASFDVIFFFCCLAKIAYFHRCVAMYTLCCSWKVYTFFFLLFKSQLTACKRLHCRFVVDFVRQIKCFSCTAYTAGFFFSLSKSFIHCIVAVELNSHTRWSNTAQKHGCTRKINQIE